jgi:hypothetical protein
MENQKMYVIGFGVFVILIIIWIATRSSGGGTIKPGKCYVQSGSKGFSNYREIKFKDKDGVFYSVQDVASNQTATYPGKYSLKNDLFNMILNYNGVTYQEYFIYSNDSFTLCDLNGVPTADNGNRVTLKSGKCKNIL